jgi:hypothetical protein
MLASSGFWNFIFIFFFFFSESYVSHWHTNVRTTKTPCQDCILSFRVRLSRPRM